MWYKTRFTLTGQKRRFSEDEIPMLCNLLRETAGTPDMLVFDTRTLSARQHGSIAGRMRLKLIREGFLVHGRTVRDCHFMWATVPPSSDRSKVRRIWARMRKRKAARSARVNGQPVISSGSPRRSRCA